MSNMSYCRFQNTLDDLRDCLEALGNNERLSEEELEALEAMIEEFVEWLEGEGFIDLAEKWKEGLKARVKNLYGKSGEEDEGEEEEDSSHAA